MNSNVFLKRVYPAILTLFISMAAIAQQPEFRGVWIATVDNIDWPRRNDYNPASQKAYFIQQLDMHHRNGMNAVIVQIRPSADAFYPSPYEPWSQWLAGRQGKAPSPYYDPLQFMITEAHKRNMEFHAWINPYRANFNIKSASIASNHITKLHPDWFVTYANKKYFNPSHVLAQEFVVNVVKDIVTHYDIDAIHMDDYFYPYKVPGKEFPDDYAYKKSGTKLSKASWRRSNVDTIIHQLNIAIKSIKPSCKFGISPFGVWRNISQDAGGSNTASDMNNYDDLYADILLWMKNRWIDYVAPQLYLEIGNRKMDFKTLLGWWAENSYGVHVYVGHGIYKVKENAPAWKNKNELPNQIKLVRANENVHGSIFYNSSVFLSNPYGWCDSLKNNYYRQRVETPLMDWLP